MFVINKIRGTVYFIYEFYKVSYRSIVIVLIAFCIHQGSLVPLSFPKWPSNDNTSIMKPADYYQPFSNIEVEIEKPKPRKIKLKPWVAPIVIPVTEATKEVLSEAAKQSRPIFKQYLRRTASCLKSAVIFPFKIFSSRSRSDENNDSGQWSDSELVHELQDESSILTDQQLRENKEFELFMEDLDDFK